MARNDNGKTVYDYVDIRKYMQAGPVEAPYGYFPWERCRRAKVEHVFSEVQHMMKTGMIVPKKLATLLAQLAEDQPLKEEPGMKQWAAANRDKIEAHEAHAATRARLGR